MTFSTPIHTNDQSFERVLKTGYPLMVVWSSKTDQQSQALDKVLNLLAIQYEGRALIVKVNPEENPNLTKDYKITALPSSVFIRQTEEQGRCVGALSKEQLQPVLEALVNGQALSNLPNAASTPIAPSTPAAGGSTPLTLTDANFEQAIRSGQTVLVDFWAAWCGPCRAIAPSIETLAKEFAGRAVVSKLNVDENPRTAQRFNIQGIPALLVFKAGKVVEQVTGAQPLNALRQVLARHA
ncbi:thioredoxin [Herpetosiphon llansteffanensis]